MAENLPEFEVGNIRDNAFDVRNITGVVPGSAVPGAAVPAQGLMIMGRYTTGAIVVPLLVDDQGRLVTTTQVISSLPAAKISALTAINAGLTVYTSYIATVRLALKQFYAGGTGIGKQTLYKYVAATTQFLNAGDFELAANFGVSTDVDKWFWTSVAGAGSIAQSSTQKFTGNFSAGLTFTNSSGNNAQDVKQVFSALQDMSSWRYISAQFYNTVSAGGAYTRTISIILTDSGGNTRTYSVSGLSTASPFNTAGWIQILGEIENPTSATGTFDLSSVASITLRMGDSANKAGTVYWDTVRFTGALTNIYPIYHDANRTFDVTVDPVVVLEIGDQILLAQKNNDATRKEYFASTSGVAL